MPWLEEEVEKVLFFVQDTAKVSERNRLIIYLLLYTAAHVSELVNIKLSDIDALTFTLLVKGKGAKVREIGIRNDLTELIKEYQAGERMDSRFHDSEY